MTTDQLVTAIRAGKRPDGSQLSGFMPYASFSYLTDEDAQAIAAFLKSLTPVSNKVVSFQADRQCADCGFRGAAARNL